MGATENTGRERDTHFAPAARASDETIRTQLEAVSSNVIVGEILKSFSGIVFVINPTRQIVAANAKFIEGLALESESVVCGFRPGEALNCVYSTELPGGCGTSQGCSQCGTLKTILAAIASGKPEKGECLLLRKKHGFNNACELSVLATPIVLEGLPFVLVCMQDISDKKRKEAMERVFFHDLLNTLNGLRGWSEIIAGQKPEDMPETASTILSLSDQVVGEVKSQQVLLRAENGTLECRYELFPVSDLLDDVSGTFSRHECAEGKALAIPEKALGVCVNTDRGLLGRVLINMVKNAFEATDTGGKVVLEYEKLLSGHSFKVHNENPMPDEVANQIFRRSFSTKGGAGRGLGTYSVKLLGEQYLCGHVYFVSDDMGGTVFGIDIPNTPECRSAHAGQQATSQNPACEKPGGTAQASGTAQHKTKKVSQGNAKADAQAEEAPGTDGGLLGGARVLAADDNSYMLKLVSSTLFANGAKVAEAADGSAAWSLLQNSVLQHQPFAAAFLDLDMPGRNGLELLKAIRGHNALRDLPVVLLYNEHERLSLRQCRELNVFRNILKPAQRTLVLDAMRQLLRRRQEQFV